MLLSVFPRQRSLVLQMLRQGRGGMAWQRGQQGERPRPSCGPEDRFGVTEVNLGAQAGVSVEVVAKIVVAPTEVITRDAVLARTGPWC